MKGWFPTCAIPLLPSVVSLSKPSKIVVLKGTTRSRSVKTASETKHHLLFLLCNPIKHPCNNLALNEAHNVQFVSRLEGADSTPRGFSRACRLVGCAVGPLCPPLVLSSMWRHQIKCPNVCRIWLVEEMMQTAAEHVQFLSNWHNKIQQEVSILLQAIWTVSKRKLLISISVCITRRLTILWTLWSPSPRCQLLHSHICFIASHQVQHSLSILLVCSRLWLESRHVVISGGVQCCKMLEKKIEKLQKGKTRAIYFCVSVSPPEGRGEGAL